MRSDVTGSPVFESLANDPLAWCAIYTKHQHEKAVAQMLSAKGLELFLPLYESTRRWKDRNKTIEVPLFPCYVFVRGAGAHRLDVLTTPGVHMLVCKGDRIATIPDDEIEAIRRSVSGPFRVEPHPFLKFGERVRVKRGALEGVEGLLVRRKGACRLVVSVEMLAQSVAVEIDGADVEAVAPVVGPTARAVARAQDSGAWQGGSRGGWEGPALARREPAYASTAS